MPYSAPALGVGLRLRSRRARSDRSDLSTVRLALVAAVLAALVGFLGSSLRADALPWVGNGPAATSDAEFYANDDVLPAPATPTASDEQRYAEALWSIHTQVEQTIARVGLGAAFYRSQEIDRGELRARLNQGLAGYRWAEIQIEALQPPPGLRATHEGYLAAVRLFHQSALEMLRMYEDGDDEHLSTAVPMSLDGTNRLREIGVRFRPQSYPAS